jgi:5,6-dimethylbenzimidazole synthase
MCLVSVLLPVMHQRSRGQSGRRSKKRTSVEGHIPGVILNSEPLGIFRKDSDMDILAAIKERRSCRNFLIDPIGEETIEKLLEAAVWAPSAANNQPWEFIVITNQDIKKKIHDESMACKKTLFEKSRWNWIDRYQIGFLLEAPVIIAVVGDPGKTGAHKFLEGTEMVYQHGCAAVAQNLLLAAHAYGLGSLWFSLFEKETLRKILNVPAEKDPLALICIGKAAAASVQTPRKDAREKTAYLR